MNPLMHQQISEIFLRRMNGEEVDETGQAGRLRHEARGKLERNSDGMPEGLLSIQGDVAVLNISGPITQRIPNLWKELCGMTDLDDMTRAFKDAAASPRVSGIILNIDSPGGSVTGVPEFGSLVADCQKPVVAFTDSMCDSAAYWIAAGADEIVSTESASVGCIGVYMAFLDRSRELEARGLDVELFKTGAFKGMGYPGTSLSEEQRAFLQAEVEDIHQWFVGHVSEHREVSGVDTFEGQDFNGREAQRRGLVDEVGDFDFAVEELRGLISMRA